MTHKSAPLSHTPTNEPAGYFGATAWTNWASIRLPFAAFFFAGRLLAFLVGFRFADDFDGNRFADFAAFFAGFFLAGFFWAAFAGFFLAALPLVST